jgi:prepilin-type N-terminal cleavage/methylation domain-containing protein
MKKNKGFTLIELIITIAIVGIISVIIGSMLLGIINAWTFKFSRNDLLWDARIAINRMTREIRTVKNSTSVITASASQFRFIDTGNKNITYSLSSTNLNRTEDGAANLLAENVSSLTFTYYNSSDIVIPSPTVNPSATDIRRVRINLTFTKNGQNVYLQSDASTKNF